MSSDFSRGKSKAWCDWEDPGCLALGACCLPVLTPKTVKRKAEHMAAKDGQYKPRKERHTKKIRGTHKGPGDTDDVLGHCYSTPRDDGCSTEAKACKITC